MAIVCQVDYLLEKDRIMCSREDMRCVFVLINEATCPLATNQSDLDAESNKSILDAPDSRGHMGKVLGG